MGVFYIMLNKVLKRALIFCCLFLIGYSIPLQAKVFGGRWPNKVLYYKVDDSIINLSGYQSQLSNAASIWSSVTADYSLSYQETSNTSYDILAKKAIGFEETYMKQRDQYAVSCPSLERDGNPIDDSANPINYEYGELRVCVPVVDRLDSKMKRQMFTHELGHILGLDHCGAMFTSSVMDESDVFKLEGPTEYDKDDIYQLYGR
jgi:hypothetical protein